MPLDTTHLRCLAQAATQGEWHSDIDQDGILSIGYYPKETGGCLPIAKEILSQADSAFIAACSPDVVLALVEEVEKLREALTVIRDYYGKEYREGEKAYQAVIVADTTLTEGA